ncbi:MAG: hypothetical protein ACKOZY_02570 [Flavobacteriales bacterium]
MNFSRHQLLAVQEFLKTLQPKNEWDERVYLDEVRILYNSDMENWIIVKHRLLGYRGGHDIDELRFHCIDPEGQVKDVRGIITDPNARWSFYHHCREVYWDGERLKAK